MQAWRMDLKTGESRLLTDAKALDPSSLALQPGRAQFLLFRRRHAEAFATLRACTSPTVYTFEEATGHTGGFALSDDGMYAAFGMETGSDSRMLLLEPGPPNDYTSSPNSMWKSAIRCSGRTARNCSIAATAACGWWISRARITAA